MHMHTQPSIQGFEDGVVKLKLQVSNYFPMASCQPLVFSQNVSQSIRHNFSLEGPIQQFKHFSVANNELFHMVHLTQKYFSTQILQFFALVPWINIHETANFE